MTTLNIVFDPSTTGRFPAYCKYDGQFQPQPAYIYLDLRDGECGIDYNADIGNAKPAEYWHGIVRTFPVNPRTPADELLALINDNAETFQRLLDAGSVEWDGNNYAGRVSDESLADWENEWGALGYGEITEGGMIDDLATWLDGLPEIEPGQALSELAAELHSLDGDDGFYFSDELNSVAAILDTLLDMWADQLYGGEEIPQEVARALLDDGRCEDSAWMPELRAYARQYPPAVTAAATLWASDADIDPDAPELAPLIEAWEAHTTAIDEDLTIAEFAAIVAAE